MFLELSMCHVMNVWGIYETEYLDESDGDLQPMVYDTLVHEIKMNEYGFSDKCYVHYYNGSIKCFK